MMFVISGRTLMYTSKSDSSHGSRAFRLRVILVCSGGATSLSTIKVNAK